MPPSLRTTTADSAEMQARLAKIDEFGELDRQIQLLAPIVARHEVLKKELIGWAADAPADQPAVLAGKLYEVHLTPKRKERTVTNRKKIWALLKAALGMDGLIGALELPLGLIDKHVPKSQQKGLIAEERSGYRTLSVVARHAATVAPAA